jgi:hypothetical protein
VLEEFLLPTFGCTKLGLTPWLPLAASVVALANARLAVAIDDEHCWRAMELVVTLPTSSSSSSSPSPSSSVSQSVSGKKLILLAHVLEHMQLLAVDAEQQRSVTPNVAAQFAQFVSNCASKYVVVVFFFFILAKWFFLFLFSNFYIIFLIKTHTVMIVTLCSGV